MKRTKTVPKLTRNEIRVIARTFSRYRFENHEEGLYYKCKGEEGKVAFVTGYVRMGTYFKKCPRLYKHFNAAGKNKFDRDGSFFNGIVKGMGFCGALIWGWNFLKSGKPIDTLLKKSGCVHIRMLVIKEEYQHMGYMRKLVQLAFDKAEELKLPCVVCTDSMEKAEKYQHLGFALFRKRRLAKHSTEYDMIWFPKTYRIR